MFTLTAVSRLQFEADSSFDRLFSLAGVYHLRYSSLTFSILDFNREILVNTISVNTAN